MKAVIMAGGFGTRIQPLTSNLPKPMIPLFNRPIMLHIVELLKKHDITDLVMLLYHQPEVIKKFFRDGSDFGVKITYVIPLQDMGTAGAVKAAEKYLDERFLVISGDLLTDFNLKKVVNFHNDNKAMATITLTSVKDPLQFGVVITDKERRITQFLEKPGWGEVISDTINTGIYVLEPEIFKYIPEGENFDFSQDLFPTLLANNDPLFGFPARGYWRDIGNTDSYREAYHDIFRGKVNLKIYEPKLDFVGKDLRIASDVTLGDPSGLEGTVVVGDNSQILRGVQIKDSVIGRNCTIEQGVRLSRCVIWDNTYVKKGARINDCVVCSNVLIGQGASLEEGVIIADGTSIGDETVIRRDVKIWPRKVVEPGSIVTANLIWGEKWRKLLFEGAIVRGLSNVELTPEFVAKLGCAYGTMLPKGSFVLGGRDSNRVTRMLKRCFMGGILSTGVNVRDLKMAPQPMLRYKLKTFGEVGGFHFRQAEDDPAALEIVFMDSDGLDFSSGMAKNVERIFFKENFRRAHHTEPGAITDINNVADYYREGFLRAIDREQLKKAAWTVVIDFNHSAASQILPLILNELGCYVIALNAYVDEGRGFTREMDKQTALEQLSKIVSSVGAQAGFWLDPTAEAITLLDETGHILSGIELLSLFASLTMKSGQRGVIAVPVQAPSSIEQMAAPKRCQITRTKSSERAMLEAAGSSEVILAGSTDGRFALPVFQASFDGMFAIARLIELAAASGGPLSRSLADLPECAYLQTSISCPWEMKGGIMRKMSEDSLDKEATFIDGIKVHFGDEWILLLPDQHSHYIHIVAEGKDHKSAQRLLAEYQKKVESWKKELE
ncbi:mannose-1-phosphate guanyltransferase [Pelobacter propionicus]|uniref:Nucleotidyltransferase n=1 Tax=Pelobacter propionicus (strain DSM 2379 / NBRC 103807 / OttBd1) TaxID=338966 RepID=A1AJZ8_PELPD|nr:mannose-1-phosphate guanyltransferase [Pelobacter propionicus]ABK97668.1 nucleotidyltransferase [Pelobacter propionicus DSM 2379]